MKPVLRFHLTNFGGSLNLSMNIDFAVELYHIIKGLERRLKEEGKGVNIDPMVANYCDRLETNLHYMGKFKVIGAGSGDGESGGDGDDLIKHLLENEPEVAAKIAAAVSKLTAPATQAASVTQEAATQEAA